MAFQHSLRAFLADDGGAVTIDWVVLTAATVGMGMAVMAQVSAGVENLARDVEGTLSGIQIYTTFEEWETFRTEQAAAAAARAAEAAEAEGDTQ